MTSILFGGKGRNEGSSPELPADCTTDDLMTMFIWMVAAVREAFPANGF